MIIYIRAFSRINPNKVRPSLILLQSLADVVLVAHIARSTHRLDQVVLVRLEEPVLCVVLGHSFELLQECLSLVLLCGRVRI